MKLITKAPSAFVPYDRHPVRYFGFITFIRGPFQSFSQSHHIHTDIYQYEDARTRNTKYEPVTGFSLGGPGVFMLPLTYLSGVALCDFASWFELLARCSSNSTSTTVPIISFRVQNPQVGVPRRLPWTRHALTAFCGALFPDWSLTAFIDYIMSVPEQSRGAFLYPRGHICAPC